MCITGEKMIKKCEVLFGNELVTVTKYDDVYIQFPPLSEQSKFIYVDHKDGKYFIVEDGEKQVADEIADKTAKKKTTKNSAKDQKKDENIDA